MKLYYSPIRNISLAMLCLGLGGFLAYILWRQGGVPSGGEGLRKGEGLARTLFGYYIAMPICSLFLIIQGIKALSRLFGGVAAEFQDRTLRVRGRIIAINQLAGVNIQTVRIRGIPVRRLVISSQNASASDGFLKQAVGQRRITLSISGLAGGNAAALRFCEVVAKARREFSANESLHQVKKAFASESADFDPDAIIARYLERKAANADQMPNVAPLPVRPGFGKKGAS